MADDSDLAFDLQIEEAIAASLRQGGAAAASDTTGDAYDVLIGSEQKLFDEIMAEEEAERLRRDLVRQVHDRALACEIMSIPEEEWVRTGDNLHRPYGEGSSSSPNGQNLEFKVYVKGLVEGEARGIGAAICDANDDLLFELSKILSCEDEQTSKELVDFKALIEGLDAALVLDSKRVIVVTDNPLLYQHVSPKNSQIMNNVDALSNQMLYLLNNFSQLPDLSNQIHLLLNNFTHVQASLVASADNKSVKLAKNAIAFHVNRSGKGRNRTECCPICMEDTFVDQMFLITSCQHSYCYLCMSKHVQFKLLQGMLPKCPHENCKTELKLESCKEFLTPELLEIMGQRVKEASIPAAQRIYCPYSSCSALLSKTDLLISRGYLCTVNELLKSKICPKCDGNFCVDCKVPWHKDSDCSEFKRRNPYPCDGDKILKSLATQNLWRQCPKCNHMVSLGSGCYHIYCRCGHEFCYTCGAEWRNKKASCKCLIWDERNIIYDQNIQQQR